MHVNIAFCAFAHEHMDVRVSQPIHALRSAGANVRYFEKKLGTIRNCAPGEAKIAIIQRGLPEAKGWPATVKRFLENDWLLIHECDDFPKTELSVKNGYWQRSLGWKTFEMCHAVQTSTPPLANEFLKRNDEVGMFPNQLFKLPQERPSGEGPLKIFFGALNRREAWQPIIADINKVLNQHPKLHVVVVQDRDFFDALTCSKKVFYPVQCYADYMKLLSDCDIALLPLNASKFNSFKSDIKFVEAAGARTAVVASPTVYQHTIRHGQTGLVARSPQEWSKHLVKLIESAAYRSQVMKAAFNYVESERMLDSHIQHRLNWYRSLWLRRKELNQKLFEKFPAINPHHTDGT